ncbi:hypothetical protein [Campylobacter sp.]|nr:hypothetical protein [Campylobacter sp.]
MSKRSFLLKSSYYYRIWSIAKGLSIAVVKGYLWQRFTQLEVF